MLTLSFSRKALLLMSSATLWDSITSKHDLTAITTYAFYGKILTEGCSSTSKGTTGRWSTPTMSHTITRVWCITDSMWVPWEYHLTLVVHINKLWYLISIYLWAFISIYVALWKLSPAILLYMYNFHEHIIFYKYVTQKAPDRSQVNLRTCIQVDI